MKSNAFQIRILGLKMAAAVLAVMAFIPVVAGGLATNTGSAPTGVLTVVLALWLQFTSPSVLYRRAAWVAVALAVLQAVMSELMVLWGLPTASAIAHDALEQFYFAWVVCLAFTIQLAPAGFESFPLGDKRLFRLTALTTFFVLWQLVAGAIFRYTGKALHVHFLGAFLVAVHAILVGRRIFKSYRYTALLFYPAIVLLALIASQLALGILSWRAPTVSIVMLHISVGALILAVSLSLTMQTARLAPPLSSDAQV